MIRNVQSCFCRKLHVLLEMWTWRPHNSYPGLVQGELPVSHGMQLQMCGGQVGNHNVIKNSVVEKRQKYPCDKVLGNWVRYQFDWVRYDCYSIRYHCDRVRNDRRQHCVIELDIRLIGSDITICLVQIVIIVIGSDIKLIGSNIVFGSCMIEELHKE